MFLSSSFESLRIGLALNTSSLTARRDSFDRNTSAFSPSLDFNSPSVAAVAAANGNGTARGKWPVNSYGGMSSVSPLAPGTPPPTGKYQNNKQFLQIFHSLTTIHSWLHYPQV